METYLCTIPLLRHREIVPARLTPEQRRDAMRRRSLPGGEVAHEELHAHSQIQIDEMHAAES